MNNRDFVGKITLEEVAKFSSQIGCEGCPLNKEGIACFHVCHTAYEIMTWLSEEEKEK